MSERDQEFIRDYLKKRDIDIYEKLVILLDNLIKDKYLGLEEREALRNIPQSHERKDRLEILKAWKDEFEKNLEKPIKAYLPRPRYYKFPYKLLRNEK